MSFFEELKRRNVIRVGIAYMVGAWLLLQLTDVLIDLLGLPETAGKYIVLLLVIGFPLALFFAWAFEMTPEGVKREHEVDRSQSITKQTGHKLDRTIIAILALALAFFVYDKLSVPPPEPPAISQSADQTAGNGEPAPAMLDPSIAVLPFVNMSSDPDQEYFSDGISEELLNLLVRVEGLKVASRTSSFTYKGDDLNIPAIAEELKVDHILEGSVRKAGNRVRITVQLIDVATDRHLWSDTFDRELVDIFAIQDEIANAIVSALKTELGVGLQAVSVETATENLDAYDLYLKARGLFIARQNLDVAIRLFEKATELDPGFALAWEGLAAVQTVADSWLAGDGIEHGPLALASAHKALEIDPDLSMAYAVLARTPGAGEDHLESMEYLDTAIENDPKNATAWLWRGITLAELGHAAKAIGSYNECLAIDPAYQNCRQHMASAYLFLGDAESAIRHFEESIMENFHSTNDDFVSHYVNSGQRVTAFLVAASFIFGDYAPIKDWVRAIENPGQNQSAEIARWKRWAESQNYDVCSLGASIVAFRFDECYFADYDGNLRVIWHPDAAYYRESQAFKDLANRQFMRYWRKHGLPPQCRELGDGDFECD
jgi:TolB-like protein/Tfp pilus assembly protein PilF